MLIVEYWLKLYLTHLTFFFFWPHPQHMEVLRPGIKLMAQLRHIPQQRQILKPLHQKGTSFFFLMFVLLKCFIIKGLIHYIILFYFTLVFT